MVTDKFDKILYQISQQELCDTSEIKNEICHELEEFTDEEIISLVGMAEMPKILYLLSLKYRQVPQVIPIENDLMLRIGECNVANFSYLAIYIHFLKIENDILQIEGNISLPKVFENDNRLCIKCNGTAFESEMTDCGMDCKIGVNIYERRTVFKVSIPLKEKDNEISFDNLLYDNEWTYGKINSMRFSPVADCIPGQYSMFDNWMVSIKGNTINCHFVASEEEITEAEERYQTILQNQYAGTGRWAADLRRKYQNRVKDKKRPIWLLMDRADRADDNAEYFFKYMQSHKEIDTYFLIDSKSEDYRRLSEIGKVIALYSEEHYLLVLQADFIISSQCNGVVENPFWENAEFFRDLYHKPKLIFLQHGVIKDDMSPTLNRYNTNFCGFITSTSAEYHSILEYPYYYSEKEVWQTGLPLFNELKNEPEKVILVMPTWRMELMEQAWDETKDNMVWVMKENWQDSEYFRRYYDLFHDKKVHRICERYGYRIAFKPHPLVESYASHFVDGTNVEVWKSDKTYKDAFAQGGVLLTDYSSVAFEFAYLRKPILYYQFDQEHFFENHTYKKGFFDYKKHGMGEVEERKAKLVRRIRSYIKRDCRLKNKYQKRIESMYETLSGNTCEMIYQKIISAQYHDKKLEDSYEFNR